MKMRYRVLRYSLILGPPNSPNWKSPNSIPWGLVIFALGLKAIKKVSKKILLNKTT
jgi:hypothetical protein